MKYIMNVDMYVKFFKLFVKFFNGMMYFYILCSFKLSNVYVIIMKSYFNKIMEYGFFIVVLNSNIM